MLVAAGPQRANLALNGGGICGRVAGCRRAPTLGTTLAPSMQASLSKVRAVRKESAAAHDYNDYGGPTHVRR